MRTHFLFLILASAASLPAQQMGPEDEAAIRRLASDFYQKLAAGDTSEVAALFTADGDLWDFRGWLFSAEPGSLLDPVRVHSGRDAIQRGLRKPAAFGELSGPYMQSQKVRLLGPGVALVDSKSNYYGSTVTRVEMYGLMIARKEAEGWRIVSYRILAPGFQNPISSSPR